jgi:hypothetical protein
VRRRRRRQPISPGVGDIVIDGQLRARLLGLHLLDIDVHVVVVPARTAPTVRSLSAPARPRGHETDRRIVTGSDAASLPELAYASRLIAEGSSLLDEARTG